MPRPAPASSTWTANPGRILITERDAATWRLADWIAAGRRDGMSPAAQGAELNVGREKLAALAKVADAFPPDRRNAALSFDIHARLAGLPEDLRFAALDRAAAEGWTERQARAAAVEHRQTTGAADDDEDVEYRTAVELKRMWNRAPVGAREYFAGWTENAGTSVIDEDQVRD